MQIEIDFEVFKALTASLRDERDTYNEVIRRLLTLPASDLSVDPAPFEPAGIAGRVNGLLGDSSGVWYSNVFFPDGTVFRATYKGQTYYASIKHGQWIDGFGVSRTSPSDAASAISGTNVNGWKFWFARRPRDTDWVRMDAFRQ
ncbi:MAG: DUF4357 domain-containing protein [Novosphingobium sp.]